MSFALAFPVNNGLRAASKRKLQSQTIASVPSSSDHQMGLSVMLGQHNSFPPSNHTYSIIIFVPLAAISHIARSETR